MRVWTHRGNSYDRNNDRIIQDGARLRERCFELFYHFGEVLRNPILRLLQIRGRATRFLRFAIYQKLPVGRAERLLFPTRSNAVRYFICPEDPFEVAYVLAESGFLYLSMGKEIMRDLCFSGFGDGGVPGDCDQPTLR